MTRRGARGAAVLGCLLLVIVGAPPGAEAAQEKTEDTFPRTASEAEALYESWGDDWLDGPVELLILEDERDIWNDLETTQERREFIDWFWGRRDEDPRDRQHAMRDEFYDRVAAANQRFHGFPRGWRSDRGRVWITLGRPNSMRRELNAFRGSGAELEVWTYYTQNRSFRATFGEMQVYFIETRPGQLNIYDPTGFGAHTYPRYLRRAFEIVRESLVVDPVTEFDERRTAGERAAPRGGGELGAEMAVGAGSVEGVAGQVLVPIRLAIPELFFDPREERFRAVLSVESRLEPRDGGSPVSQTGQWVLAFDEEGLVAHGNESLQAAVVLAAEEGDYQARVRVRDDLGGGEQVWEGRVRVDAGGARLGPVVVATTTVELSESGAVGAIGRPGLAEAGRVTIVSWLRGVEADPDAVQVTLVDAEGAETQLSASEVRRADGPAGPLALEVDLGDVEPGDYTLRLQLGEASGETDVRVR